MLGSAGVIAGTAVQLVDAQGSRRWLWITLVVVGAVVAVPALMLQSPWWTERQRQRIERAHHDRVRAVVGGPGSGKSAVVGRLVILADLDLRAPAGVA